MGMSAQKISCKLKRNQCYGLIAQLVVYMMAKVMILLSNSTAALDIFCNNFYNFSKFLMLLNFNEVTLRYNYYPVHSIR